MSTILITGGTGLIGRSLGALLREKGYDVIILTRAFSAPLPDAKSAALSGPQLTASWDPDKQSVDPEAIRRADCIVHLAGAGVADKRWSAKRKKEIQESRTRAGELVVKALKEIPNNVKTVVSISAIGWYGPDNETVSKRGGFQENDPADPDFLGETCRMWEQSISPVEALGKRLVLLRSGIVFSKKGGALDEFKKPVRMGIAAILGNGRQVISWIHIEDLCRLFLYALEHTAMRGIYNAVAPGPVTNHTLTVDLARKLKGLFFIQVKIPSFLLKIILGEMSIEVLKSATVSSAKTLETGFQFHYPTLASALPSLT